MARVELMIQTVFKLMSVNFFNLFLSQQRSMFIGNKNFIAMILQKGNVLNNFILKTIDLLAILPSTLDELKRLKNVEENHL